MLEVRSARPRRPLAVQWVLALAVAAWQLGPATLAGGSASTASSSTAAAQPTAR